MPTPDGDPAAQLRAMLAGPYLHQPVDAFDPADPVVLDELTGHQLCWRVMLHQLAVTRCTLRLPTAFLETCGSLAEFQICVTVAAGWQYTPQFTFPADGRTVVIACRFTRDVLSPAVRHVLATAANPTHS